MFWLIISIVVTLGLFIGFGVRTKEGEEDWRGRVDTVYYWAINKKQLYAVLGLLLLLPGFISKVPVNSVGIVYSPFGGTKQETLSEGFHTKNILDKVYKISTEVQTMTVENLTTQTKDAQFLNSTLDIK